MSQVSHGCHRAGREKRPYLSRAHPHELWRLESDPASFSQFRVVNVEEILQQTASRTGMFFEASHTTKWWSVIISFLAIYFVERDVRDWLRSSSHDRRHLYPSMNFFETAMEAGGSRGRP